MEDIHIIIIVALSVMLILISLLFIRKKNAYSRLYSEKVNDIIETNRLLLEKSENELKLFFEFEAAVEETIKIGRKSLLLNKEILLKQKDIVEQLKKGG